MPARHRRVYRFWKIWASYIQTKHFSWCEPISQKQKSARISERRRWSSREFPTAGCTMLKHKETSFHIQLKSSQSSNIQKSFENYMCFASNMDLNMSTLNSIKVCHCMGSTCASEHNSGKFLAETKWYPEIVNVLLAHFHYELNCMINGTLNIMFGNSYHIKKFR